MIQLLLCSENIVYLCYYQHVNIAFKLTWLLESASIAGNVRLTSSCSSISTGYRVAPFAQFNDGLMDMTLCQNATRGQLLEVFAQLPIGAHVGRMNTPTSSISQIQIQRCKFSLDDGGGVITIDGDVFAYQGDLTIQCKKHAFRIFAPQNAQALPNPKAYVVTYK